MRTHGLDLFLVDEDSNESFYGKFCQEDFKLVNMLLFRVLCS